MLPLETPSARDQGLSVHFDEHSCLGVLSLDDEQRGNADYFAIHDRDCSRAARIRCNFSRRLAKDVRLVTAGRRIFVGRGLPASIITLLTQTRRQAVSSLLGMGRTPRSTTKFAGDIKVP